MNLLADFLLARIAEDEERSKTGRPFNNGAFYDADGNWIPPNPDAWHEAQCGWRTGESITDNCVCDVPERVLADCDAKRRIVGYASPWVSENTRRHGQNADIRVVAEEYERTLRALVAPYADHKDYQESWTP